MDIKAAQAERFVKSPPREVVAFLLYGPDLGQVSERGGALAHKLANDPKNPGELIRLDDTDISGDPDRLAVELRTIPMFGGRKVVRLRADARMKPELIGDLIDGTPLAGVLVVEAGNLKPESKLRAVFVSASNAAAIACYGDDDSSLATLVNDVAAEHKLTFSPEARDHLTALLGADRSLSRNEVEKLALYAGKGAEVTIVDIDAIVGDASELELDQIVHAAAGGAPREALTTCDRAIAAGEDPQTILIALLRHFLRLHLLAANIESGKPMESVLRSLRPPLHFKAQPLVQAELRKWSLAKLSVALGMIQQTTKLSRQSAAMPRELTEKLLLDLTRLAASRQ
jgi:DNA polymerase III subunit delta